MSDNCGTPKVLLCVADLRWEAAWRRADTSAPIARVATLVECLEHWSVAPASVAVIEFAAFPPLELLGFLAGRPRLRDRGLVILVGGAALDDLRFDLMECGADLVVSSERQLPEVCRCARRHLKRWKPPEWTVRERVWSMLPWSAEHRSTSP